MMAMSERQTGELGAPLIYLEEQDVDRKYHDGDKCVASLVSHIFWNYLRFGGGLS